VIRPPQILPGQRCFALLAQPLQATGVPRFSSPPYPRMLALMARVRAPLTDSGGTRSRALHPNSRVEACSASSAQMTIVCGDGNTLQPIAHLGMSG